MINENKSNMPSILSQSVANEICSFIRTKCNIDDDSSPLGKRIFEIIENYCTVIYYPIEDASEENDGFLMSDIPMSDGSSKSVIYINTYQTEEKQVFAAAHELGHFLNVDYYIKEKCDKELDSEAIVNRFAAELLMPNELFRESFFEKVRKKGKDSSVITNMDMFSIIVELMDVFAVPYNAVVIRLVETEVIDINDGRMLVDGNEIMSLKYVKKIVERMISVGNYNNLTQSSRKCEIRGLEELLNRAEKKETESLIKINRLREKFGIIKNSKDVLSRKDIKISKR